MMLRMLMARRLRQMLFSSLLFAAWPLALSAQVGATTDIITGVVRTPAGLPVENAQVEAQSTETQVTRRQRTNAQGKYTILFPDGGGTYRLTIRYIGFQPTTITVVRNGDDDRIVRNITLGQATAQQLARVEVRATQRRDQGPGGGGPPAPGGSERVLSGDQTTRLPVDASDPTAIAALAPGVVLTGADTSGGSGAANFSVAGQSAQSNNVTLDGLSFASGFVPQDAVRGTRVVTNTYDVARGQFSGGQVSQTTRSGTNVIQGSMSYIGRYREMTIEQGGTTGAFGGAYDQNQFGAGIGFPIIKDRLFFFGALQGRRRADLLPSLLAADDATRSRLGASPDSVNRFLSLVDGYGIAGSAGVIDDNRNQDNLTLLGRMDLSVTDAHTLTLRGDWRLVDQSPTRVGSLALPQTGGTTKNRGGGGFLTLSSRFGTGVVNELRAGLQLDDRTGSPFVTLPLGRVQVLSDLSDGTQGLTTMQFGGSTSLLSQSTNTVFEATNETSLLLDEGKHRVKVGGLLNRTGYTQDQAFNRFGTFTFNSLADFQNNVPASFSRTLASPERTGSTTNSAIYIGDTWRPRDGLQLVIGGRFEGSSFSGAPARNLAVDSVFNRRTDEVPTDASFLPRVGFSWSPRQPQNNGQGGGNPFGNGALTVRGGIGRFRDAPNTQLFSGAQTATGLAQSESQVFCVGSGVPIPDWSSYFLNPGAIPATCAAGAPPSQLRTASNVTTFDSDYSNPRAWRGSLGASKRVFGRFSVNVDFSASQGEAQTGYRDLNLNTTPQFTIAAEGNRPVFVPAASIITTTGAIPTQLSRIDPRFGSVYDVNSRNKSKQWQGTVGLNGFTSRGAIVNFSYTYANARDQSSLGFGGAGGGFAFATTAGNPNIAEWAPSGFQRKHVLISTVTHPLSSSFEITAIGRMTSGAPFTPLVSADINGDGSRNDRAFIYDPTSTADANVAQGMTSLLDGASKAARTCIESQIGRVASRNSCVGPWQPSFDLQLNWRPTAFKLDRRLTFSLVTANLIGGIDQALHGSDNLRGWGSFTQPDNTLLYVRGFDAATNTFKYEVNERFGAARGNQTGIRLPFQVGFNIRYTLGPDQTRDRLRAVFGASQNGRLTGEGISNGLGRFFPNIPQQIIDARDSIGLPDAEVKRLQVLADSIKVIVDSLTNGARAVVEKEGGNPDPAVLFGVKLRPFFERAGALRTAGINGAKAILSEDQWKRVPDRIKTPQGFGGPGGGPGGGRRPGGD